MNGDQDVEKVYRVDVQLVAYVSARVELAERVDGCATDVARSGGEIQAVLTRFFEVDGFVRKAISVLKKIQKAGKLVFVDGSPAEVYRLCQELEPAGLLVATACKTVEESRDLITRIRRKF